MELYLFDKDVYALRRARLRKLVGGNGIILLPGNDELGMNYQENHYAFRQDSTFLYYFGLDVAGLTGVIDLDGDDTIYGTEITIDDMVWTGPMPTLQDMAERVGVKKVLPLDRLADDIKTSLDQKRTIHILPQYRGDIKIKLASLLNIPVDKLPSMESKALTMSVIAMREVKEDVELAEIDKAVSISADMHLRGLVFTKPGMKEYEVGAQIEAVAKGNNGRFAYPLIYTVNGEILHNHGQSNTINEGRLVLCDAGAENEMHYAGDLTRTFPASKKFTEQQREVYNIVLASMDHAISLLKPGISYRDVHRAASTVITDGLKQIGLMKGDTAEAVEAGAHALFLPHGLGHMMGLDVHDMENLGEDNVGYDDKIKRSKIFGWKSLRLGKELKEGFVFTVEPGVYFVPGLIDQWSAQGLHSSFINYDKLAPYRDFGGIRIEDNYVITNDSARKLGKHLPKTADEIEALRN